MSRRPGRWIPAPCEMVVSSPSVVARRGRVLAGVATLVLAVLVGAALYGMVSRDHLPDLARQVASYRATASAFRLLVLGMIAASWRHLAPRVARRTGREVQHVSALGWRVLAWAAVLELSIGQDLLGRMFR
jgi:cytochrome bd-type quinol oxidase subunit 2